MRSNYYFRPIPIPLLKLSSSSWYPPVPGLLHPLFPHGGRQGHMEALVRGSGASNNGDPVTVVVVVVSVIIFVVPVTKVNISRRLREEEGYPHVDHRPGILVVVVLSPRPPSAAMMIVFPIASPPPPSGRMNRKRKRKRKGMRRARQGRHRPPRSPAGASERLPAVRGGIRR